MPSRSAFTAIDLLHLLSYLLTVAERACLCCDVMLNLFGVTLTMSCCVCLLRRQALVDGFQDTSALFRHEIAYVLGQIQSPLSSNGLSQVLLLPLFV